MSTPCKLPLPAPAALGAAGAQLTPAQRKVFGQLVAAGAAGLALRELPVRRGYNPMPSLIFAGFAEFISGTKPARYRAKPRA